MKQKIENFINGQKVSYSKSFLDVFNPSTGEIISQVVNSNEVDLQNCLNSSLEAQKKWKEITPLKRSRVISNFLTLVKENIEDLAKIISKGNNRQEAIRKLLNC